MHAGVFHSLAFCITKRRRLKDNLNEKKKKNFQLFQHLKYFFIKISIVTLILFVIKCYFFFLQTLLQNNASAMFLNTQLSGTELRVSDIAAFLSKTSVNKKHAGSVYTWRDVFNETNHAIQTISRFMEVSVNKSMY